MPKRRRDDDRTSIDAIQIRPLLCSHNNNNSGRYKIGNQVTTFRLPVTLGRHNLALIWWQACACQAYKPASLHACAGHCRPLRQHVGGVSRSLVVIDAAASPAVCMVDNNNKKKLVHWKGPKMRLLHGTKCWLHIGEDPAEHSWMAFQLTAVCDKRQGPWRRAMLLPVRRQRRIWVASSGSSSNNSDCSNQHAAERPEHKYDDDDDDDDDENDNQSPNVETRYLQSSQQQQSLMMEQEDRRVERRAKLPPKSQAHTEESSFRSNHWMRIRNNSQDSSHDDKDEGEEAMFRSQKPSPARAKRKRNVDSGDEDDDNDWMFTKNRPAKTTTARSIMRDKDRPVVDSEEGEGVVMMTRTCQVVRRDCHPMTAPFVRKVTPDEKRNKIMAAKQQRSASSSARNYLPLTQEEASVEQESSVLDRKMPAVATTRQRPSAAAAAAATVNAAAASCEQREQQKETPMLSLPGMCLTSQGSGGSTAAAEMLTWQEVVPPRRRRIETIKRPCRDLVLADWQRIQKTAQSALVRATSELVVAMNAGRHENSPNLLLPDLLAEDATILLEERTTSTDY